MPVAFVIRPFNVKKDSAGTPLDFDRVYDELILPALKQCGIPGGDMGEIVGPGNIREDMFAKLVEAELVICDVSIHNANVFYELGIRHALRKKRTIMIKGGPTADSTPFDVLTDRYVNYDLTNPSRSIDALVETINASRASSATDSPILNLLQDLPEADPKTIQAVPPSFLEDLGRARAAKSKGWLRLLAYEVEGLRFERPGRQLVGDALWRCGDLDCARETLEKIRELEPNDVPANLALANIYERLYRSDRRPETLSESDQAIARVLNSGTLDLKSRVEALALKGRNQKTRWRNQFERLTDESARRAAAMNQSLRDSYEAYRDAFQQDLNHFYSGIAALQMGVVFLELSKDPDTGWEQAFHSDREAAEYREDLETDVTALKAVVKTSAEAAAKRPSNSDSDRLWAGITRADLLFLGDDRVKRIVRSYKDALPADDAFAWNAVLGQLRLFAMLGISGELTRQVIADLEADLPKDRDPSDKPLHVVIFAGHRVDEADRTQARLPAALLPRVQEEIERRLKPLTETHRVVSLASAAPGGDLIFHEVCGQLGIQSTVCLPMPEDSYVATVFDNLQWRSRFLQVMEPRKQLDPPGIVHLCDGPGLPPWLYGAPTNAWERGNRWVLEMAATWGAAKVTLLTVWDGRAQGDAAGGTAHMVGLARTRADVDIIRIEPAKLFETASI